MGFRAIEMTRFRSDPPKPQCDFKRVSRFGNERLRARAQFYEGSGPSSNERVKTGAWEPLGNRGCFGPRRQQPPMGGHD